MCISQAKGFAKLVEWRTKKGIDDPSLIPIGKALPEFRHHSTYDNAPSHHKRDPHALNIHSIAKGDGHGKYRIRDTTWKGEAQSLVIPVEGGEPMNKGLQTIGFERGHWDKDGKITGKAKSLTLAEMRDVLRRDPDFASCPTILESAFKDFPVVFSGGFSMSYLAKFWCTLAWIEQYWNDVKEATRQKCDYTMPGLKVEFPIALRTACPSLRIRNYVQRALDHVKALIELGRKGDFNKIPALRKVYKSHRRSELIRLGLATEKVVRVRDQWGEMVHSRLLKKNSASTSTSEAVEDAGHDEALFIDDLDSDSEDVAVSAGGRAEAIVEAVALFAEAAAAAVTEEAAPVAPLRGSRVRKQAGFYSSLLRGQESES